MKRPAGSIAVDREFTSEEDSLPGNKTRLMKLVPNKFALLAIILAGLSAAQAKDPLPSWNDGAAKKSITDFVAKITTEGSSDLVPPEERIATFDNDGTLWCEQPLYFQLSSRSTA